MLKYMSDLTKRWGLQPHFFYAKNQPPGKPELVHVAQLQKNNRTISIIGVMKNEGGQRMSHDGCVVFDTKDTKKLVKFKPLNPITQDFEKWFIEKNNIKLCKLYYPPFNFKRTGCKGCPFSLDLQEQLEIMEKYLPNEKKQCETIWKPIYEEYRKIGYRLQEYKQLNLFEDEVD